MSALHSDSEWIHEPKIHSEARTLGTRVGLSAQRGSAQRAAHIGQRVKGLEIQKSIGRDAINDSFASHFSTQVSTFRGVECVLRPNLHNKIDFKYV